MGQALDPVTRNHVDKAAAALASEFAGVFSEETITRSIGESLDLLGARPSTCSFPCSRTASRASG